jgi:hypothetical protein
MIIGDQKKFMREEPEDECAGRVHFTGGAFG